MVGREGVGGGVLLGFAELALERVVGGEEVGELGLQLWDGAVPRGQGAGLEAADLQVLGAELVA